MQAENERRFDVLMPHIISFFLDHLLLFQVLHVVHQVLMPHIISFFLDGERNNRSVNLRFSANASYHFFFLGPTTKVLE